MKRDWNPCRVRCAGCWTLIMRHPSMLCKRCEVYVCTSCRWAYDHTSDGRHCPLDMDRRRNKARSKEPKP